VINWFHSLLIDGNRGTETGPAQPGSYPDHEWEKYPVPESIENIRQECGWCSRGTSEGEIMIQRDR